MFTTEVFLLVHPATVNEIEWLLILLSLVSIGEAGGLSYTYAAAEDEVTEPSVFWYGGETICPANIGTEPWWEKVGRTKAAALPGPPIGVIPC